MQRLLSRDQDKSSADSPDDPTGKAPLEALPLLQNAESENDRKWDLQPLKRSNIGDD